MDRLRPTSLTLVLRLLATAAALLLLSHASGAADAPGWLFPHFSGANGSVSPAVTAPAGAGSTSVPNLGTFANGASPVTAHDGTVYLGNEQGRLMAFSPDGVPIWNIALSGGESIVASAMVWNNDIYVVGTTGTAAALYRFDASGNQVFRSPFPQHRNGGIMTTAPNITFAPGTPLVVLPAAYKQAGAAVYETRLLLFNESGALALDQQIDVITPSASGGFDLVGSVPEPPGLQLPLPMAASWSDLSTGRSYIVVADGFQTLLAYEVTGGGLIQKMRRHQDDAMRSFVLTPVIQNPGVFYAFSSRGYLAANIDGSHEYQDTNYFSSTPLTVIPTAGLSVFREKLQARADGTRNIPVLGRSIAAIAASKDYVYVSTEDAFTTFLNRQSLQQVSRVDWVGGGRNPPVIGPKGHVYAVASNILFIFPPPKAPKPTQGITVLTPPKPLVGSPTDNTPLPGIGTDVGTTTDAGSAPNPQPISTTPQSQLYDPPLTMNGNRLFACEELDQDDCGKGDYTDISLAWCQKQGYPKVKGHDVDSRKVKAETLDGRFCSKNKCKVFDSIACEM